ncbi:MAG: hypothetical protein INH43_03005 [Acidobacteriaceae bacterium]|nr:hypothetical protein [Acidobacteriaceae bacterium]
MLVTKQNQRDYWKAQDQHGKDAVRVYRYDALQRRQDISHTQADIAISKGQAVWIEVDADAA